MKRKMLGVNASAAIGRARGHMRESHASLDQDAVLMANAEPGRFVQVVGRSATLNLGLETWHHTTPGVPILYVFPGKTPEMIVEDHLHAIADEDRFPAEETIFMHVNTASDHVEIWSRDELEGAVRDLLTTMQGQVLASVGREA